MRTSLERAINTEPKINNYNDSRHCVICVLIYKQDEALDTTVSYKVTCSFILITDHWISCQKFNNTRVEVKIARKMTQP